MIKPSAIKIVNTCKMDKISIQEKYKKTTTHKQIKIELDQGRIWPDARCIHQKRPTNIVLKINSILQ